MFENLIASTEKNKEEEKLISISDLTSNSLFNSVLFKEKLKKYNLLNDKELYELLHDNYITIFCDIFVNNDSSFLDLFTEERFLTMMIRVINCTNNIPTDTKLFCNKLAYDYITNSTDDNEKINSLFFSLSKSVNRSIIPILLGIGLDDDLSAYIALAFNSSQKDFVNIKRLNLILMKSSPSIMTEQRIVWIYEKLFKSFTSLFEGTMFDVYDQTKISEDMDLIYSTCNLAILDILNSMESNDIRKILISYAGDYEILYNSITSVRFSMHTLSNDYYRINNVINALASNEGIYVP